MKAAFAAIVGRPSSGKSTLLNAICGYKVSITSPVPQTTRNKIRGVFTEERGQIVFIDTPGYHLSEKKFNKHMIDLVTSSLEEVDLVLYIIDGSREPGEEEARIAGRLSEVENRLVIVRNKIDIAASSRKTVEEFLETHFPGVPCIPVSATEKTGLPELKTALFELSPEGEIMYPPDFYTDQEPEFRASELIREKALIRVRQEVPHALYVEIADMEADEEEEKLWVRAFLVVERESQKGILIGKKGTLIREIRLEAQKELNEVFPYKVHLDLRVKVNPKWRKKESLLGQLIR